MLSHGEKKFTRNGRFCEPGITEMLSPENAQRHRASLQDPSSIILSQSAAEAFFGDEDPTGKVMRLDDKLDVTVSGVYEDLPHNSTFADVSFLAPGNYS